MTQSVLKNIGVVKKINRFFLYFSCIFIFTGCENEFSIQREGNPNRNIVRTKNDLEICLDSNNSVDVVYDLNSRILYEFKSGNLSKIRTVKQLNDSRSPIVELEFYPSHKRISYFDYTTNEIVETQYFFNHKIVKVFSAMNLKDGSNLNLSWFYTVNDNNDTINYFLYEKNNKGFEIKTDIRGLTYPQIDSSKLIFVESKHDVIRLKSIDRDKLIPIFKADRKKILENTTQINSSSDEIYGSYLVVSRIEPKFRQHSIIISNDLFKRIDFFRDTYEEIEQLNENTLSNKYLLEQLIKSNAFVIENGVLVISPDLRSQL